MSGKAYRHAIGLFLHGSLSLLCSAEALSADANYVDFELNREDNWAPLITRDMNGDGLLDLVYSHTDRSRGRELWIHHQQQDGSFANQPQRIEIKSEIIAVGFADLRDQPGDELVLFADRGIFSLSTAIDGYANNLKPLLQWPLLATVPDRERVVLIEQLPDINGDGHIDLLLPGDFEYGVFLGGPNESFRQSAAFDVINQELPPSQRSPVEPDLEARLSINSTEGVVVALELERGSPYADFVQQAQDVEQDSALLDSENWIPTALLRELDGDGLLDVMYLNLGADGRGQINVHYQQQDGQFAEQPDWTGSLDTRGELRLADFNGDGLEDLLRIADDGSDWTVYFYRNDNGQFEFASPNQVMRFSGYDLRIDLPAIDEGAGPVLSASYYTIPVVDAIRNASIDRNQLVYLADPAGAFQRRPSMRVEQSFSASNVRGLSEQISLAYDVNGDGRKDALYITELGTLAAKQIDADLALAEEPFWEYVSDRGVFEFEVLPLNQDAYPDLILRHGTRITILVASPAGTGG